MADKVIYFATHGPYHFDDSEDMPSQPGVPRVAIRTDSQMIVTEAPSEDENILRLKDLEEVLKVVEVADIDSPLELTTMQGAQDGSMILAFESGDPNSYTIYAWDNSVTSSNSPYVLLYDANSGWVAIAGKYNNLSGDNYFWVDGTTVGFKLRRDNVWAFFKLNSTYNGLTIDHLESA